MLRLGKLNERKGLQLILQGRMEGEGMPCHASRTSKLNDFVACFLFAPPNLTTPWFRMGSGQAQSQNFPDSVASTLVLAHAAATDVFLRIRPCLSPTSWFSLPLSKSLQGPAGAVVLWRCVLVRVMLPILLLGPMNSYWKA
jgi:hypothetical protein